MSKRIFSTISILVVSTVQLFAQVYINNKSQHRFAQTYLGMNVFVQPESGMYLWKGEESKFPAITSPRITIGGLHFWGKLDFTLNFPIARFGDFELSDETELNFNPGGDFSARFYPWQMQYGKIRPYLGYSANEMTFGFDDETLGSRYELFITSSAVGGFSYAKNDWQLNAELMWMFDNTREFYSNPSTSYNLELPKTYFSIGLKKYFEGTLPAEESFKSGQTKKLEDYLRKEHTLNSFSIGIAPSGGYSLLAPHYPGDPFRESLPRHKGSFLWEYSAGYLFNNAGIHVGVSYRNYLSDTESYGFEHLMRRRSFAIELIKFKGNYQGFVPFIGPSISFERWAVGEFQGDVQVGNTVRTNMISPGIIFGWDILASPLETWVLRTNLRYYPFQRVKDANGKTIRVDQFEFNYIQLVIYPNRIFNISKAKRRL